MTRSVEELRLESERTRAELTTTVDRLRQTITDTAEDIRYKVSPQHIRSEVSGFVSDKAQSWVETLKQQAMENPLRTVAAATLVAVPVLRLARGLPLPLLMMGAGLALTSKGARDRTAEMMEPVLESARGATGEVADRARSVGGAVADATSSSQRQAADLGGDAQDAIGGVTDKFRSGMDAASELAKESMERVRTAANEAAKAPAAARQAIGDNAALIGTLGIAIGAIIAAALPETKAEAAVMGQASDDVKRAAGEAAHSGFEAAKDAAFAAADAAGGSAADLGEHASRVTQGMAETLKEVADDVVTTAFEPSPKPNT
ncbi:DUF3618 domain-containing protein [Bradyrhizobium sp. BRP22]|uniref:DUF3618 domain-containing protein n=1 Tax=Bradyrhizobium sp. BRP22 TaxID=2793821 RepID=UPI001CD76BE3|nr:DUF3618 domain-containing protein [Bradyrhizobium sp. BRP22]MCA1457279.1 DUF3618 domain-containing protein [Bradyrhizobium sp. BRP22]